MSRFGWMLKAAALHVRSCVLVLGLGCAMAGSHAKAQSNAHQHFGKVHFPIACNDGVQEQFDLALAMLHTFSFPDAAQTFTAVAQKDPDCAMAYWGIAATAIGSLYGGRPGPMALQGEQAVEKAKAIRGKNARERDYIATVEVFCKGAETLDYAARVRAYASALERLHRKYPEDREAEIFYGDLEKSLSPSPRESDSVTARGHGRMERAGHGAEGLFRC